MKIKKIVFVLLLSLLLLVPLKVSADMFPKPVAEIEVVGLEEPYYFEVLVYYSSKVEKLNNEEILRLEDHYAMEKYPLDILNGYQDDEGFAARTIYSTKPASLILIRDNVFKIGYFSAPKEFKIAIILEDGRMITSDIINRRLFDSKMTYDLSDVDINEGINKVGILKEHIPYGNMAWKFLVRVVLTILVELLILSLFLYKRKQSYVLVGITNLITQSVLSLLMICGYYFWGFVASLIGVIILGELLVFICEMALYTYALKEQSRFKAISYGFIANLATLILAILTISFI